MVLVALLGCTENKLVSDPAEVPEATPAILVEPQQIDFGVLAEGEEPTELITITSVGDATLFLEPLEADSPSFDVVLDGMFAPLAPGDSIDAIVTFSGLDGGEHLGVVEVGSDDPANPLVLVELTAERVYPLISVEPDPLEFAGRPPGDTAWDFVTITNQGEGTLVVSDAMVDNTAFFVETADFPIELGPGEYAEVDLSFTPSALESYEGSLEVFSNASGDANVSLIGEGLSASLRGRICDPSSTEWVVDAEVWVEVDDDGDGVSDRVESTLTDEDGYYTLENLLLGTYTVYVAKGRFETSFSADVTAVGLNEHPDDECLEQGDLNIALVRGGWDNMQPWLTSIGLSFDVYRGDGGSGTPATDLWDDMSLMSSYDIIFIECGQDALNGSTRMQNLDDFVDAGGVLYMNDLVFYSAIQQNWPTFASRGGSADSSSGKVYDSSAVKAIGTDTVAITLSTGVYLSSVSSGVTTVIDQPTTGSIFLWTAPYGSGYIAFSSLHVQYQTPNYQRVMQEVILSL